MRFSARLKVTAEFVSNIILYFLLVWLAAASGEIVTCRKPGANFGLYLFHIVGCEKSELQVERMAFIISPSLEIANIIIKHLMERFLKSDKKTLLQSGVKLH